MKTNNEVTIQFETVQIKRRKRRIKRGWKKVSDDIGGYIFDPSWLERILNFLKLY